MIQKYKRYFPVLFFVLGFLFDIVTLSRVDDRLNLVQQGSYIFIVMSILLVRVFIELKDWKVRGRFEKVWKYNNEALHFLLGSLLSVYFIFYFNSSSFVVSAGFLLFMFLILILNELPIVHDQGPQLKFALWGLCLFSYSFILAPMILGSIGWISFLTAILFGLAIVGVFYFLSLRILNRRTERPLDPAEATENRADGENWHIRDYLFDVMVKPVLIVAGVLFVLYLVKMLPPVPLSIQHIGVYHDVEKLNGVVPPGENSNSTETSHRIVVRHERSWWRLWQSGDQNFLAEPGDRIFCFVRVFAPFGFKDDVMFRWLKKGSSGWETSDKIKNTVIGGRDDGFRGFAAKTNFESGEWRVQVETTDGREIGRINFEVEKVQSRNPNRKFQEEYY